jgi:hypothetical protein
MDVRKPYFRRIPAASVKRKPYFERIPVATVKRIAQKFPEKGQEDDDASMQPAAEGEPLCCAQSYFGIRFLARNRRYRRSRRGCEVSVTFAKP